MKAFAAVGLAAAMLFAFSAPADAGDVESGLQVGKSVPAFQVVKIGGADDGVAIGKQLCYRWRLGGRPVVMVFAKETDADLASLVKEIEKAVKANADKNMSAFVNIIGSDDREALEESAKEFVEENQISSVPIAVPVETELGPRNLGINPEAEVTVMLYSGLNVKANHAFEDLDEEGIKKVTQDFSKILK